ncbi:MAG: IS66 family transposase [Salinivirgaceae bacterium]|nr:IS66 family transposase [Salinivirgaceae bacterium]
METATLPNNPEELKKIVERCQTRIEYLEERVRVLTHALFGRKSEKRDGSDEEGPRQLHLFNEAEACVEEEKSEETLSVPAHTRRKPKRKPLPPELPRIEVIHDLDEGEKVCACGAPLCRIGEEVSEKLDIIPATVRVIRNIRPKYACKHCEGVEDDGPTVRIAPSPPQIVEKGIATPGLLAHIIVSKYADALPLYRQEKIFSRHGIELSRQTMAGWIVRVAQCANPLMALLERQLLLGPVVNADETPVQVLNEPGRANTTRSYMWVFRGGDPPRPVILFRYHPSRSGDVPRKILSGYQGFLQTDAFSAYEGMEKEMPGILLVGCFAHVRRNFIKVIEAKGKGAKQKPGSAEVALGYIQKLYAIEKMVRASGLSPPEMLELRKQRAQPVLDEFKGWMDKRVTQTPPKGLLGKALSYALKNWPKLVRYLESEHITPDNNLAENAIRPFVIGRRNWLFAGHPNGAHAAATLYSLIETAKACGLGPYRYLRFLFEKLPYAKCEEDHRQLLAQNVTPEQLADFIVYP